MEAIDPARSYEGFEDGGEGSGGRDGGTLITDGEVRRFFVSSWVASCSLSELRGFTKLPMFFRKVLERSPS
jgi:hypothetical protein